MNWLIAGGMINCALFLMGVFAASLVAGNYVATVLALVSCGLAVLHYDASLGATRKDRFSGDRLQRIVLGLHYTSNLLAVAAAVVLIVGYVI